MSLPFERTELPVPSDPVDAAQLGRVTSELNAVTRLISMKMPGDPDVRLFVQFSDGYSDLCKGAIPFVGQPGPIVQGRTDKAVRIERAARNLLANPSFEAGLEGWSAPDAAIAISRDLGHPFNGDGVVSTAAMRMQGQNRPASPWAACTVAVESHRRYSASAWVCPPDEATTVQVDLVFHGGNNPSCVASPPLLVPAGKWTRLCVPDAFSGDNTACEVRVRLAQEAPSLAIGSRVSSWAPTGTCPAKDNKLQIYQGDVVLAAVSDDASSNGGYRFHMATATVPGPGDPALRLDDAAQAPALAVGSRVSIYRPAPGDTVPVGDKDLPLNAGDLVFCRPSGKPYGFAVVTTGAVGVSSPSLRLDDDGSPPDFDGALLSRFVPSGTALAGSTGLTLATGDMAFCHRVDAGRYDFVPVTSGGTGPGDPSLRLADESAPPSLAAGSRLSFLSPSHTALATDTTIALAAGDAILASTVKAPMDTGYRYHMVTVGGSGPADPALRVDDAPTTAEIRVDCVQLEEGRSISSYLDHLQGLGYAGQATTATSRTAGTLSYPLPEGLSPEEGTMAFWFRPNYDSADGEAHFLVDMAEAESTNRLSIRKDVAGRLAFTVHDGQDGMRQVSTSGSFGWSAGDWVHIAATWRNGSLQLYFQGQPVPITTSGSGTAMPGAMPDTVHVGSSFLGFDQADGLLTDLVVADREMLPDRIAAMASNPTGSIPTRATLQPADIPSLDHWKIQDFDAQVHSARLDQMAAPTADVSMNSHRVTGLADPTAAQDAATRHYVDDRVAATNPMTGAGDLIHGGTDGVVARLGANTATRRKFLMESGTGAAGNAPAWGTPGGADLRDIYVAATGSADTYSATADPSPASLVTGMMFLVRIPATNTGASTLDLNSLGATSIKTPAGGDPPAGALVAGGIYLMVYDGTCFQQV